MNYLVCDVGGSSIKYALMDENAKFYDKGKVPVPKDSKESLYKAIQDLYNQYEDIKGVGLSLPGVIDPDNGYTYTSGAINTYNDTPFVQELSDYIPVPITIGNDAKCAANAEIGFGSFKDVQDGAIIVLGTGIGGCLVKDHKVHTGKHFSAGEASCIITDFNKAKEWDYVWSSRNGINGLLNRVQESLETEEQLSGEEIFERANNGDEKVIAAIKQFTDECAVQLLNIHTWFDTEKIAIGGGISAQPLLLELLNQSMDELYSALKSFYYPCSKPVITKCTFGNDANLIGALYQHLITNK